MTMTIDGIGAEPPGYKDALTLEQALLLTPKALDRQISSDLRRIANAHGRSYSIVSWWQEQKARFIGWSGRLLARQVKRKPPGEPEDFCDKIDYCRRRKQARTAVGFIRSLQEDRVLLATEAYDKFRENNETIAILLEEAMALTTEIAEFTADTVVPVTVIAKIVLEAMDEICPCPDEDSAT
ncbi:hypothetical protein I5192_02890 [Ruegeria sp. SCSIO 43209]|uniref:hypothetical protein n=1 Tax=Ruegeria sp. SCSIO 43209 TaxID=2793010 RepID=UPI001CA9F417|nr:hypothetical protein [Ruegeria sp. SCSIO 43209]UAB89648.1 hypothetical protein I5192_02890 [Ruegeria sp. SCSIO 43209]